MGRHAKTATVQGYDLDGHPLGRGFAFGPRADTPQAGDRAEASGLAVDAEHRLWVADAAARAVRAFTLFGREVARLGGRPDEGADRLDRLGAVVDVALDAEDPGAAELVVAARGRRRHALRLVAPDGALGASLRPRGDPQGRFDDLAGVSRRGRFVLACERRGARVQVFRDGDFHFAFRVPAAGGARFEPTAAARLTDGRMVVCQGAEGASALLLVDAAGELLSELAPHGRDGGRVFVPNDVVVEEAADDAHARVAVIDSDGDRVQVFNLAGRCYGSFLDLPVATE